LGCGIWSVGGGGMPLEAVGVKWGLILLASILSVTWVGVLFRLAPADVAALAAAASLLSPGLVILFYALARVLAWLAHPVLAGGASVWPFLSVVSPCALAPLALRWVL